MQSKELQEQQREREQETCTRLKRPCRRDLIAICYLYAQTNFPNHIAQLLISHTFAIRYEPVFALSPQNKYTQRKKGTKTVPLGHHFGKRCLFWTKRHQNSAPKGTILRTTKRCRKGTILVPLIFLSVVRYLWPPAPQQTFYEFHMAL